MESTSPALAAIRERMRWNQDVVDVLLALGLFVAVTTVISTTVWVGPLTPLSLLLIGGQTLPLAVRRRYPVPVLIVTAGATGLIGALGFGESGGNLGVLIALYTVAANTDRRTAAWAGLFTGLGIALAFVGYAEQDPAAIQAAPSVALIYAITWIVGDSVRQRREETARYKAASAQHRRDREERARLAVVEERARIARELHDVVAHYVSVMVVQAGAARRTAETDSQASQEALNAVEGSGRTALAEMRRMLEVLREEDAGLAPQPTLDDLGPLLTQLRSAGLPVALTVTGPPRTLPAGVDLAGYRIVQEALTNVVKHAGPAAASVHLGYAADRLEIEVTDDGRGAAAGIGREETSGHGLIGMRERVTLYGGELQAGPQPSGGYRVWATVPLDAPASSTVAAIREPSATTAPAGATRPTETTIQQ